MRKFVLSLLLLFALASSLIAQHNGTIVGSPAFGASSPAAFGQVAYQFSDSNYISLPSGSCPSTATFTTEFRVNISSSSLTNNVQVIAICGGNSSQFFYIGVNAAGNLVTGDAQAGPYDSGLSLVTSGAGYNFIRVVRTATAIKPYVNCTAGTTQTVSYAGLPSTSGVLGSFVQQAGGLYFKGALDEVQFTNVDKSTSGCAVPSAPYTGSEANAVSLYHLDGNVNDSSGGGGSSAITIDPSNAGILYAPGCFNVVTGSASTINSGCAFRTIFTGTSVALSFNVSNAQTPLSQIACAVDRAPVVVSAIASSVSVASGLQSRSHLLECKTKSTTETNNRWNSPSATMFSLTGILVDSGATVSAPQRKTKTILVFGDSITEGVRVNGMLPANDTDRNNALAAYSDVLSQLDAEVGNIGFGGSGISVGGSGNVPALPSSWSYYYSGAARTLATPPDVVIINEGTNDSSNNIVAAYISTVQAMQAAWPNAKFLLMRPFSGNQAANVQAVATATGATYVDTTGWFNSADSPEGIHPYADSSYGILGPKLLPYVTAALYPGGQARSYGFN